MANQITVVQVNVGEEPAVTSIVNELKDVQEIVGGYMEFMAVTPEILLIINEEGKLKDLPTNFIIAEKEGAVVVPKEVIVGNVFFVSMAGEELASLDKVQIKTVLDMFKHSRNACILS